MCAATLLLKKMLYSCLGAGTLLFLGFTLSSFAVSAEEVVAVADLHGDYVAAVKALQLAGVLGEDQRTWIGDSKILIQLGDIVDRGDNSREIYELLFHLQDQVSIGFSSYHPVVRNPFTIMSQTEPIHSIDHTHTQLHYHYHTQIQYHTRTHGIAHVRNVRG